jgi:cytochrome c
MAWMDAERRFHGDTARGKALVARFECNRCHEGTGLPPPAPAAQCAGCHAHIIDGTIPAHVHDPAGVQYYLETPSLAQLGRMLRPSWIASFLREPVKVRSHAVEWMPRLRITDGDAQDVAAYLTSNAPALDAGSPRGDAERGKQLAVAKGCLLCHEFTGASRGTGDPTVPSVPPAVLARGIARAPDLRLARDRVRQDTIVRWIMDPSSVRKDAVMPRLGLSADEAADVATYILATPLAPAAPPKRSLERLPLLDRRVTYEEVAERVFRTSCVHCHELGGPGDTGGFGFPPRGVDVTTDAALRYGYVDKDGTRRSLMAHEPALESLGGSRLVAALVARHEEVEGRPLDGIRGMPLGLAPLSPEQIQLAESWVAQGAGAGRAAR